MMKSATSNEPSVTLQNHNRYRETDRIDRIANKHQRTLDLIEPAYKKLTTSASLVKRYVRL